MEHMSDSELKVMEALWSEENAEAQAKTVADHLTRDVGWNKNTTYTLIKRLIEKRAVERSEPGFWCKALVSREAVQRQQSGEILDKLFGGSASKLFAALVDGGKLKDGEVEELRKMIDRM